jgi:hypothetical protein
VREEREGDVRLVRLKRGRWDSDRQRDLSGPLEPHDRFTSPPVRHAGVDEARFDVPVAEVILDEIDRLAGVEEVGRDSVP